MPYVSDSQRRLFHAKLNRGEMKKSTVSEFDRASKGMSLPEAIKKAFGGYIHAKENIEPEEALMGHEYGYNFPPNEEPEEGSIYGDADGYEENPQDENISYVKHGFSRGGRVRMSKGGMAFLSALKRNR